MHHVESYNAEMSNYVFIAVMVVVYIVKQVMKMKKKQATKPFVPVDPFPVSIPEVKQEPKSYEYEEVEDEWAYAPEPTYDNQTKYSEKQLENAIDTSNGDLYEAISKLKSEGETIGLEEKLDDFERFDEFKIKEKKKNNFADLLDDPENFKNAFILSEILNRRH